jgi:hypothetical protein
MGVLAPAMAAVVTSFFDPGNETIAVVASVLVSVFGVGGNPNWSS